MTSVLTPYDPERGIAPLGEVWALRKGAWTLRCGLSTHPLGWELRLEVGANLTRSEVCKTEARVFDVSEAWKLEATGRGWQSV